MVAVLVVSVVLPCALLAMTAHELRRAVMYAPKAMPMVMAVTSAVPTTKEMNG